VAGNRPKDTPLEAQAVCYRFIALRALLLIIGAKCPKRILL
jgi:hypothetical protein